MKISPTISPDATWRYIPAGSVAAGDVTRRGTIQSVVPSVGSLGEPGSTVTLKYPDGVGIVVLSIHAPIEVLS